MRLQAEVVRMGERVRRKNDERQVWEGCDACICKGGEWEAWVRSWGNLGSKRRRLQGRARSESLKKLVRTVNWNCIWELQVTVSKVTDIVTFWLPYWVLWKPVIHCLAYCPLLTSVSYFFTLFASMPGACAREINFSRWSRTYASLCVKTFSATGARARFRMLHECPWCYLASWCGRQIRVVEPNPSHSIALEEGGYCHQTQAFSI